MRHTSLIGAGYICGGLARRWLQIRRHGLSSTRRWRDRARQRRWIEASRISSLLRFLFRGLFCLELAWHSLHEEATGKARSRFLVAWLLGM